MATITEPETTVAPEPAPKHMTLRRRVMSRISIQSKLLVMLLVTSILSAAVVGFIGYQSGPHVAAGIGVRPADRDAGSRRSGNCRTRSPT